MSNGMIRVGPDSCSEGVDQHGDGGHLGVRGRAVLVHVRAGSPGGLGGGLR